MIVFNTALIILKLYKRIDNINSEGTGSTNFKTATFGHNKSEMKS